ncbi:MAG TPA: hypothetical protein VHB01_04400 [Nitrosospira sp.]|nr:hypothetical protein [Nitrosospira sp.]
MTAATVGTGDVLGLPFFLTDGDFILKEMEDGTLRTTGTFVAGDGSTPSGTTGDVRGGDHWHSMGKRCFPYPDSSMDYPA